MKSIKTDLSRLDEIISKSYEDKIRGLAKDSLQNSWEARKNRKKGTCFEMTFSFYSKLDYEKNVLILEDFGTTGMDKKRWEAFHSHWRTTKGDYKGGIGRWGQGKTLFLYFSSTNQVITETVDTSGNYKYSVRNNTGYLEKGDKPTANDPSWLKKNDGTLKLINDFFPTLEKLDHPGTRVIILKVKEDLAEEIKEGYLATQLSESWWELIRNYKVKLGVNIDSNYTKITLPQFPNSQDELLKERISINEKYGKINKLEIFLAEKPIPESLRGIAIQRGRMTVCRHPIPTSYPEEIRERVYGYCNMDETLDELMWKIELSNHEGFESKKWVWITLRKKIDNFCEEFLSKYLKGKDTAPPKVNIEEIIKTVNKLVDEHLTGFGKSSNPSTHPNPGGGSSPDICISPWGYLGKEKKFNKNDEMDVKCGVVNKTKTKVNVNLKCFIQDSNNWTYWTYSINNIAIEPENKKSLTIPTIIFSKLKIPKGKYFLKAELKDNEKNLLHHRSAVFFFECNPPPDTSGWLKSILFSSLGGPKARLRNLPINDKGELLINMAHPEFHSIWSSKNLSKKMKTQKIVPVTINIALHEATREMTINWYSDEKVEFDVAEIKRSKDIFDEMWGAYYNERAF